MYAAHVIDDQLELVPRDAVLAVAMSGGVDSSVAAARVVQRGFRAFGVTVALLPEGREMTRDRGCCSVKAVEDARRVADGLGIPHEVWHLAGDFESSVLREFEDEYAAGRTPNPCIRCNERIKFGALLERARSAGATHLVTGHYARRGRRPTAWTLHRARDATKDQAYTLHRLDQEQLASAVFPLGSAASKHDVRREAATLGLVTAVKPDSQDLCFVDGTVGDELRDRLAGRFAPGPIIDNEGRQLGEHRGLPFYTVGQRRGLGIAPQRPDALALHVIELRPAANTLVVGPGEQMRRSALEADDCRWVAAPPLEGSRCQVQLRAHGEPQDAIVASLTPTRVRIDLAEPATQISPGQSAVLYDGDEVLGGGIVKDAA